jgi:hypothetical protein
LVGLDGLCSVQIWHVLIHGDGQVAELWCL